MTTATAHTRPEGPPADPDAWEHAYLRFETPAEEQRKFTRRLRAVGADGWRRDALILDMFSGRGGGAAALRGLGFSRIVSADLSPRLLHGRADASACSVADCRQLPIASDSVDVAIVQGGLHHLMRLPQDLSAVAEEVVRVLKPEGVFVAVEPWRTPFLDFVHWLCFVPLARRMHSKIDALATMIELERTTYDAWLASGHEIFGALDRHFVCRRKRIRLGKLHYVGVAR
jgi:SAM-dependent methyltransferase